MSSEKQSFDSCFEVFLADTPEGKEINYNLRYRVYCEEMGFEDKDRFPDQMESDDWDDHAVHFLLRHKGTGDWLGGVRLVAEKDSKLPFEEWSSTDRPITAQDRKVSVEMSRLCIVKEARRFASRRFAPYGLPEQEANGEGSNIRSFYDFKNQSRSIMWGLVHAAGLYSAQQNFSHWYFIVAPSLACFLNRGGLELEKIGAPCEHRGTRTPYQLSIENLLANPMWLKDYKEGFRRYSELEEQKFSHRKVRAAGAR